MKLEANTPVYKLLEQAYHAVGSGANLNSAIDAMRKVAESNPSFKAMFPTALAFPNAAKAFLRSKGVTAMVKLEAKSRLGVVPEKVSAAQTPPDLKQLKLRAMKLQRLSTSLLAEIEKEAKRPSFMGPGLANAAKSLTEIASTANIALSELKK